MIANVRGGKNIGGAVMFLWWLSVQENGVFICERNKVPGSTV